MKFAFAAIVVGLNIILWEGCSSSNGTTTQAPTTAWPTSDPAPNGVFTFNGTDQPLEDLLGEVHINNASTPSPLMTKMLLAPKDDPYPLFSLNTKPVPFHMEGDKITFDDLSAFDVRVRGFIESATFTYALDESITFALTKPMVLTIVFDKVKSSSGRLLRETYF